MTAMQAVVPRALVGRVRTRVIPRMLALVFATLVPVASGPLAAATAEPGVEQPRAYGHSIGDVLEQTFHVEVPPGTEIDPASLPRRGRADRWLARLGIEVAPEGGNVLRIRQRYQVINSPPEVRTVMLPEVTLKLVDAQALRAARQEMADGGRRDDDADAATPPTHLPAVATARFEAWPVTIGPMTPETVLARAGLDLFQPDRDPPPGQGNLPAVRFAAAAATVALVWFWPALARTVARMGRQPPFKRATRSIERLHRGGGGAEDRFRDALREFHRALDAAQGERVFAHDLDSLFRRRPGLAPVRDAITWFFARSRAMFFADEGASTPVSETDWRTLIDLARQCRRLERQS